MQSECHDFSVLGEKLPSCTSEKQFAGEPISTRWTASVKQEIMRSRVEGTRKVVVSPLVTSAYLY